MAVSKTSTSGDANKKKALDLALSTIEKQFGKGAIMKLDGTNQQDKIPSIPTGCLSLDLALGIGGIPKGRIIEIYGPESSGKTTLTLHIAAEAQKQGFKVAIIPKSNVPKKTDNGIKIVPVEFLNQAIRYLVQST